MQKKFLLFNSFRRKQTKKETIPYPICSVIAVFKMLVRILNMLRSRIWDRVFFLFSDYPNLQLVRMGIAQKAMVFIRMNISRRRYFLTRLYKNYIYLLLPHGEFFLWLTLIIFWRIPFSFQQKSLICYLLSKPDSR